MFLSCILPELLWPRVSWHFPPVSMLMYAARCTKKKNPNRIGYCTGKEGEREGVRKPLQSCILLKYAVGGRAAGRGGSSSERAKGQRRNIGARRPAMQMTAPSIRRRRAEKGSSGASLNLEGENRQQRTSAGLHTCQLQTEWWGCSEKLLTSIRRMLQLEAVFFFKKLGHRVKH